MSDQSARAPAATNKYQLNKFNLGNATSRAPIIIGMTKFPSTAGIDGIKKNQTISTPWTVKSLLYVSEVTRSPAGVRSSIRSSAAATAAVRKETRIVQR